MDARKKTQRVALTVVLAAVAALAAFGLYRTTTSRLGAPVWPEEETQRNCWPDIDWREAVRRTGDSHNRLIEEAITAIDEGVVFRGDDAVAPRVPEAMKPTLTAYEDALGKGKLRDLPLDPQGSPLRSYITAFGVLPDLHALVLRDIVGQMNTDPAGSVDRLATVLDRTYGALVRCGDGAAAAAWALNLRRTLDLANGACGSLVGRDSSLHASAKKLANWASPRTIRMEFGLDSMFIADYHHVRKALLELVRRRQWWIFTWLPYDLRAVSSAVDACYVKQYAFGVGTLWEAPSAPVQPEPGVTGRELQGTALRLADGLCEHATSTWRAVALVNDLIPKVTARLERLRRCAEGPMPIDP